MAENSILGSAWDDPDAQELSADAPTDASPRVGIQADDSTTDTPVDQTAESESPGSEDGGQLDKVAEKRINDARRKMHEEIRKAQQAEAELYSLKQRLDQIEQAKAAEEEKSLMDSLNPEDLAKQFEEDPTAAFRNTVQSIAKVMHKMQTNTQQYIDAKVQRIDPMAERIEQAYQQLAGERWFQDLNLEAKRGAAIAAAQQSQDAQPSSDSPKRAWGTPPPPNMVHGATQRVPKEKKKLPMSEDPRYRDILTRMGGLKPERAATRLNEV